MKGLLDHMVDAVEERLNECIRPYIKTHDHALRIVRGIRFQLCLQSGDAHIMLMHFTPSMVRMVGSTHYPWRVQPSDDNTCTQAIMYSDPDLIPKMTRIISNVIERANR